MEKEKIFFDVVGLIALRKSDFYKKVIEEAKKRKIKIDEEQIKQKISNMNNEKFISKAEEKNKRLDLKSGLDSLNLDIESFMIDDNMNPETGRQRK